MPQKRIEITLKIYTVGFVLTEFVEDSKKRSEMKKVQKVKLETQHENSLIDSVINELMS